jgi:hypothetical protein
MDGLPHLHTAGAGPALSSRCRCQLRRWRRRCTALAAVSPRRCSSWELREVKGACQSGAWLQAAFQGGVQADPHQRLVTHAQRIGAEGRAAVLQQRRSASSCQRQRPRPAAIQTGPRQRRPPCNRPAAAAARRHAGRRLLLPRLPCCLGLPRCCRLWLLLRRAQVQRHRRSAAVCCCCCCCCCAAAAAAAGGRHSAPLKQRLLCLLPFIGNLAPAVVPSRPCSEGYMGAAARLPSELPPRAVRTVGVGQLYRQLHDVRDCILYRGTGPNLPALDRHLLAG